MKNYSIWKDNIKLKNYPTLTKDKETDVLIIGGGITGVSTFYELSKTNLNIMLVEQNKIGMSITANSTGKLTFLQNDLINKIRRNFNDKIASQYIKSQIAAINIILNIIKKEKINCDLEKVDSVVYTNNKEEINKVKDFKNFIKDNGIDIKEITNFLVESKYMFSVNNTYIFNPVKYVYGLLKNFEDNIYENTSIKKIEKDYKSYVCYTDNYKIKCKYVIIASHYPYFILPYMFPIKESLEKSYLSASK